MLQLTGVVNAGLCCAVLSLSCAAAPIADSSKDVDWNRLLPKARSVLEKRFPGERVGKPYDVGIVRPGHIADITGDGVSEALVWLGTGGASNEELTLMRIEQNQPVVALFKDRLGKTGPMFFLEGASVMHGERADMLPRKAAVVQFRYDYQSDGKLGSCRAEAYRWNAHTGIFDYGSRLSTRLAGEFCRKVPRHL